MTPAGKFDAERVWVYKPDPLGGRSATSRVTCGSCGRSMQIVFAVEHEDEVGCPYCEPEEWLAVPVGAPPHRLAA